MNLTQILEATVSPVQNELQQAQTYLEQAAQENLPQFIVALVNELADGGKSQVARMAAGLQLKNALTSKDPIIRKQHQQRWLSLDEQVKLHVKQMVIQTLGTEAARPAIAPQCIAAIACTEIPKGQWLEVIDILHRMVWAVASKEQALQSIGYICEDIEPNHIHHLTGRSREIQAAIVLGGMINPNINIKLTAFSAFSRSLKVLEPHFNVKADRDIIMEILCQATKSDENQVRVIALQNLVKIMKRYYQHMEHYMVNVLPVSISAIESNCDEVARQGIEFWSSVCDKEIDLVKKASECCESKFYAKHALKDLIPVLINFLKRQGGLDDKDDWNARKAAGVCLMLLVECCKDDVYPRVVGVFNENEGDYRGRDAAFMALGPHLNAQKPYVETAAALLFMYTYMIGESLIVTDSLAWTLYRMWEFVPQGVWMHDLTVMLSRCLFGEPRVAVNACWVLRLLMVTFIESHAAHEEEAPLIGRRSMWLPVSKNLDYLIRTLDANQEELKSAVKEASRICRKVLKMYISQRSSPSLL